MNAILIDTHKHQIGSIILKESLKVLSIQEEKNGLHYHSVWRFEIGDTVQWKQHKSTIKGKIVRIIEDMVYIKRENRRYTIPIQKLFPSEPMKEQSGKSAYEPWEKRFGKI